MASLQGPKSVTELYRGALPAFRIDLYVAARLPTGFVVNNGSKA